jgi:DivIVA domain-containing protein
MRTALSATEAHGTLNSRTLDDHWILKGGAVAADTPVKGMWGDPMSLTVADVRNVAFSKAPIGKPGYHKDEVDDLLDLVEALLVS